MEGSERDGVELDLPARPEYLALVRSVVTAVARSASRLPPARIDDLRLAVTEACANAIDASRRAGAAAGPDGPAASRVRLRCQLDDGGVVVEVHDGAGGFDPDAVEPPPAPTGADRLKFERGLGIPLMRTVTDGVEFHPDGGGTTVRLVVHAVDRAAPGGPPPG